MISLTLASLLCLAATSCTGSKSETVTGQKKEWAIALHGGAGVISEDKPDSVVQAYKNALQEALSAGREILQEGGSALDAVESVIIYLEDNPLFNAGKGAVFNREGEHELDAAVMIGNTRQAGAVTGVRTVKNPITLARKVMEESEHVMIGFAGVEQFAGETGVERVDPAYFYTKERYKAYKEAVGEDREQSMESGGSGNPGAVRREHPFGTVGCVAVDRAGQIVAGSSTGGMTGKLRGRVGDVPVIGSGTYASDLVAVSMTGWGEKIMKAVSGHTVSSYMRFKTSSLKKAGDYLLNEVLEPGEAGMIAVDRYGNIYMNMNTQAMFRAAADSDGRREIAIW